MEELNHSHQNGNGAGMPLAIAAKLAVSIRWPTPTSMDSYGSRNATCARSDGSEHHSGRTLLDEVLLQGGESRVVTDASAELAKVYGSMPVAHLRWATPRVAMARASKMTYDRGRKNLEEVGASVAGGGFLSPRFVECLMSFPDGWTERPDVHTEPFAGVWRGWPARPNEPQHPWEAPRVTTDTKARKQRLKALGNAVVPEVARVVGHVLAEILKFR